MIGGIAAALVAPVVFDFVVEYPIALVAALALIPVTRATGVERRDRLEIGLGIAVAVFAAAIIAHTMVETTRATGGVAVAVVLGFVALVGVYVLVRHPTAHSRS